MKIYCGGHLTTNNATTAIVIGNKQFSTSSSHSRPLSSNVGCALAPSFNKRSQPTTGHATRVVVSFLDVQAFKSRNFRSTLPRLDRTVMLSVPPLPLQ